MGVICPSLVFLSGMAVASFDLIIFRKYFLVSTITMAYLLNKLLEARILLFMIFDGNKSLDLLYIIYGNKKWYKHMCIIKS